jgi:signal transduction histidine kinase
MKAVNPIVKFFVQLTDVRVADPDDARRRKLLNILLVGTMGVAIITAIAITVAIEIQWIYYKDGAELVLLSIVSLTIPVGIYLVNRYVSGRFASILFLLFLVIAIAFSDTPDELSNGRSLFLFIIPIFISSVLISPSSSFTFYGIAAIELMILSNIAGEPANLPALTTFLLLTLLAWLSSRSLEDALRGLRTINAELDQRVADRTKELSESLARESEQGSQRQAILQGIADGVVVFDISGKAILANPALSRLINIPLDQIISHDSHDIFESSGITNEDRETLLGLLSSTGSSAAPMRIRWGEKTLSVSTAPVRDSLNKFIGTVAVFRDFTREAEVEEMKNSFVAMVSHELRTPLNAILGYSEMLRDAYYGQMNDKQTNAADRILNNSRRLLDIVSDLLDKAQIEAGHLNMKISAFQPNVLTENLHSVMDKITHDKGLELASTIAPEMPDEMKGDPERIQQVMVNLVNNAAKFTEKGGIHVNLYKVADEYWAFDVTDTGPGIAPEDQRYIFDPFRQVDKTATRSHGGIGLGLAIVKRLVDLMGGRIFLKSIVGQGSTFTVVLPFEPLQKGK